MSSGRRAKNSRNSRSAAARSPESAGEEIPRRLVRQIALHRLVFGEGGGGVVGGLVEEAALRAGMERPPRGGRVAVGECARAPLRFRLDRGKFPFLAAPGPAVALEGDAAAEGFGRELELAEFVVGAPEEMVEPRLGRRLGEEAEQVAARLGHAPLLEFALGPRDRAVLLGGEGVRRREKGRREE